jgi:hypothetical protein
MELIGREALQQQQPAVSFKQEICAMMYVFGDVPRPNQAAAELIEAVIHKHMTKILNTLDTVRKTRDAKTLGMEDIFFLYRNEPVKIKRMLDVLRIKETARSVSAEEDSEGLLDQTEMQSESSKYLSGLPQLMQSVLELPGGISVLDIDTREDVLQKERNERADLLTDSMDVEEYMSYAKQRKTNYSKDPKKLKEWLSHPLLQEPKLSSAVLEGIGYVCYEATREFVEKCLLVKAESCHDAPPVVLSREQVHQATNQIAVPSHMTSPTHQHHLLGIQPSHVNEVLRRQSSSNSSL